MHFFIGGCDWFAAEYDPKHQMFFGFAILGNDYQNAEWGYFDFNKLCAINIGGIEIDRDLHFTPKKAMEVEKIRMAQGW